MKTRILGALVGLAISFALPTFAQQKETVDPQIIEQINNTILKKYTEAMYNSDAAAIAALFTEDAVFLRRTDPSSVGKPFRNGFRLSSRRTPKTA
jgi:hypothetical protein